ncbi:putative helicase MAGATAMA 3 [Silene latifolia]|uniref:putative helicase MAGATAMA 3 n=1 Tax=Silene latifolia TaxID=37657 RepID=UPI003D773B14
MAIDTTKLKEEEACFTRFYKIVLSWDYFNLSKPSKKASKADELKKVKDTYTDVDDYFATFEPLLFEEVKAQIVQTNDEEETSTMEQKLCLIKECSELDGFHFPVVIFLPEERESISQNDLLLLSNDKFRGQKLPSAYAFALVEHRQMDSLRLRVFLVGEVQGTNVQKVKPAARLSNMRSLLGERTPSLFISKVCSLSTIFREFVGIRSICSNPFKDVILKASDNNVNSNGPAWEIPSKLMESIESNHNESQLEAIRAGLSRKPFVLIQGPPGTGKTQTILGLLNAILHAVPARIHAKLQSHEMKRGPELPMKEKCHHWRVASPWLIGANPRDMIMPVDGDDGFFPTTGNELKPEVVSSNRKYRVRVLVCAPSNSALDEIVLRVLNTGVRDENNHAYHPKIVRIGLKAHHTVQSVSMDYLVEQKLASLGGHQATDRQKHGATGTDRDNIRASILDDAVIVFCTLSFSGSTIFSKMNRNFDIVIIDEAAQAVEPATLIPLAAGCKQVFLVGDPVQLPATVISTVAEKLGYGTSLFKRFQKAGYPVLMLKTQYRMHPEIRAFPSREFYEDALEDGEDVEDETARPWHNYHCFRPFCFFDIKDGAETQPEGSGSWVNEDEVSFAMLLYRELVTKYSDLKSSSKLAIISPYRGQVKLFRQRFKEMFGVDSEKIVDINTVDGFQGREKDVTIFSCVRASKDKGIGFVSDYRRMNVGITRARSAVLVVGSASTLKRDNHWGNLIETAVKNETLFEVTKPYSSFFSEEHMESMKKTVEEQPDDDINLDRSIYGNADDPEDEYGDGEGDNDVGGDDD